MNAKSMTRIAIRWPSIRARPQIGRVAQAGRELRRRDPVRVRLLVDEAQRVLRHEASVVLLERALVEELAEADRRRRGGSGGRTSGTRSSPSRAAC